MKIYITGLPSGYEVEHLVRLFYPMHRSPSPRRRTPRTASGQKKRRTACMHWCVRTAEVLNDTHRCPRCGTGRRDPEFSLASLTYDLLRDWTGIRPPWGKMTGVRPVRLIHDKRAAGWTEAEIDHFSLTGSTAPSRNTRWPRPLPTCRSRF